MSYFQYAIFSILLFTANLSIAQEDTLVSQNFEYDKTQNLTPVSFDEVQLEDYKNDSDFDYTEVSAEKSWLYQFKRWIANIWSDFCNIGTGKQIRVGLSHKSDGHATARSLAASGQTLS